MMKVSGVLRFVVPVFAVVVASAAFLFIGSISNRAEKQGPALTRDHYRVFAQKDAVTADIRNKGNQLLRVDIRKDADRETAARYGRIVSDHDTFVIIAKKANTDISGSGLHTQELETSINLPSGKFEPLTDAGARTVTPESARAMGGAGYFIVQFGGTATDELLESIRDAGVEVLQYVPHQAFYVYGDSESIARVAEHSRVRWVGEFATENKVSPALNEFTRNLTSENAMFDVAVFARADLSSVQDTIGRVTSSKFFGRITLPHNFFGVIRVEMPVSDIGKIAAIADVVRIDPYIRPAIEDERSSQIIAGNFSSLTTIAAPGYNPLAQFGVDGSNVTVMVSDDGVSIPGNGGFYLTSSNTVDAPLRGATAGAAGGHGHLNASIIAGAAPFGVLDPLGYNYGLGVAPKANIINVPFLKPGYPFDVSSDAVAVDDALNTIGPNGVRGTISNNSWGSGANSNSYDSLAATYDGLVRDGSLGPSIDPFSIIFSAGNSGPAAGTLTRPKVAKNSIAVANSENLRTEFNATGADNIDDLRSTSSRGPAADGRIKPDITAPGTVISGSRAGNCTLVSSCFDANHAWSTGTSHAAPQIAGAAALFTQYWRNSHAGSYPSPALIKAAILNTGQEMSGSGTSGSTIPNGNEGWGRINMKMMMNTGVAMKYVNEEHTFNNPGTAIGFIGSVADSTKPVRIALVWTDPPAASDPALVNDLDLQVNVGGNIYRGNNFSGGLSLVGGVGDTRNNVEIVSLPAGIPAGTFFSVSVSSTALNGDGVLGNADTTDQNFALVAYNFNSTVAPAYYDVSGQVVSADGRGMARVMVTLSNNSGIVGSAMTNGFGYFTVVNILGGQNYTVSGSAKRHLFSPQNVTVNDNLTGLVIAATQ